MWWSPWNARHSFWSFIYARSISVSSDSLTRTVVLLKIFFPLFNLPNNLCWEIFPMPDWSTPKSRRIIGSQWRKGSEWIMKMWDVTPGAWGSVLYKYAILRYTCLKWAASWYLAVRIINAGQAWLTADCTVCKLHTWPDSGCEDRLLLRRCN